jgi:probable rRNA maturation factor
MIVVDIQDLQDILPVDGDLVGDWAQQALTLLGLENAELSVVLTDNAHIRELNRTYLDRDHPTNVISFPQQEGVGPEGEHLGDIVISVERAQEEAADSGMETMERLMQLLVHGICHLTGYNHEGVSPEEALEMEEAEQHILAHLQGAG